MAPDDPPGDPSDDDLPGEPGDAEHSWLGLMRSNYITMVEALGGDAAALETALRRDRSIGTLILETIQGGAGVVLPPPGYLRAVRALCDRYEVVFIADEVQCGFGRTGRRFAFQHTAMEPDILTVAKALGNGVPIGACLARGAAADVFQPGKHGSTFGGNPLAASAALAVISRTVVAEGRGRRRARTNAPSTASASRCSSPPANSTSRSAPGPRRNARPPTCGPPF